MADAYQTVDQKVYWGDNAGLADIGQDILSCPISSDLAGVPRVPLGASFPTYQIARVNYRLTLTAMAAEAAQTLIEKPAATAAVIQTDALTGLAMDAAATGLPRTAAAQGVVTASVPVAPRGAVYRCKALKVIGATSVTVGAADGALLVAETASGQTFARGSDSTIIAKPGLWWIPGAATSITVPGGVTGWLLYGPEAKP